MKRMKTSNVVAAALLLCAAFGMLFTNRSESPLKFDSDARNRQDNNERLRMVGDLKPKLMGARKTEVENLLGEPLRERNLYPGDYYYYVLGTQQRFGDTDGIWLCLRFKNDRVDAIQIARD